MKQSADTRLLRTWSGIVLGTQMLVQIVFDVHRIDGAMIAFVRPLIVMETQVIAKFPDADRLIATNIAFVTSRESPGIRFGNK